MTVTPLARDSHFRVGEVSYNGVNFPPAIKSTGRYEPVYDDSGRIVKYVKGFLSIETYVYSGCLEAPSSNVLPYHPSTGILITNTGSIDHTTDTTLETIRGNLSLSAKKLIFKDQGFGKITLNDSSISNFNYDVDSGPKPKIVSWVPLSNKMAKVNWECEFAFSPCWVNGQSKSSEVAQFPFTVQIHIGPGGLTTRTIEGKLETALTRIQSISLPFDMIAMEKYVLDFFPVLKQFKREQTFRLSNDRKILEFTITDTEINSDDAYPPGVENEDVELSMTGTLNPGAFRRWAMRLHGSIDLMAGTPKIVAYEEMSRLFQRYVVDLAKSGDSPVTSKLLKQIPVADFLKKTQGGRSLPIIRSIKFTDQLFGRSVGFEYDWDLFVSLDTLFKATGIFVPIEANQADRDRSWTRWKVSLENVLNFGGWQELGMTQNDDIIVSLCQPIIGNHKGLGGGPIPGPNSTKPKKEKPDPKESTTIPNDDSTYKSSLYNVYQPKFFLDSDEGTLYHAPLRSLAPTQEAPTQDLGGKKDTIYPLVPGNSVGGVSNRIIHKVRPTVYTLTFSGYAIRLGYPVPVPSVKSIGGKAVMKVGQDQIRPTILGTGLDVTTGSSYSIHGLVWNKSYALTDDPIDSSVETDGYKYQYPA